MTRTNISYSIKHGIKSVARHTGAEVVVGVKTVAHGLRRTEQLTLEQWKWGSGGEYKAEPRKVPEAVLDGLAKPVHPTINQWINPVDKRLDLEKVRGYQGPQGAPPDGEIATLLQSVSGSRHEVRNKTQGIRRDKEAFRGHVVELNASAAMILAAARNRENAYSFHQMMRNAPTGAIANYLEATNSSKKIDRETVLAVLPSILTRLIAVSGERRRSQLRIDNCWRDAICLVKHHFHSDESYVNYAYYGHRNIFKEAIFRHKKKEEARTAFCAASRQFYSEQRLQAPVDRTPMQALKTATSAFGPNTSVANKVYSLFEELSRTVGDDEPGNRFRTMLACVGTLALKNWGHEVQLKSKNSVDRLQKVLSLLGAGIGAAPFGAPAGLIATALDMLAHAAIGAQTQNKELSQLITGIKSHTYYNVDTTMQALNALFEEAEKALGHPADAQSVG